MSVVAPAPLAVRAYGISKHFGGVQALSGVDFDLRPAEIHGLVGENGAGKSTFVRVLAGEVAPDAGQLVVWGRPVTTFSTAAASARGVSVIHQEMQIISGLTVAENILLGHFPSRRGLFDRNAALRRAGEILEHLGAEIPPSMLAARLTIGQQQLVEISRALAVRSTILILDEPTAALTSKEADTLFRVLRTLRSEGVAILYISHRLDELQGLVDRLTVFRDGSLVATRDMQEVTIAEVIELMTGTAVPEYQWHAGTPQDTLLEVHGLRRAGQFEDVSFAVRKGECCGLYGLLGSGQDAVIRTIAGEWRPDAGEIWIKNRRATHLSPQIRRSESVGYVPADRKREGLALPLTVRDNMMLGNLGTYARWGIVDGPREMAVVAQWMGSLQIRPRLPTLQVRKLSGGNQQKVVLARSLEARVGILLLNEPTRGVDVATRREIYRLIGELRTSGLAILMVSSDAADIVAMCDRILVMRRGRIEAEFIQPGVTKDQLLRCAIEGRAGDGNE